MNVELLNVRPGRIIAVPHRDDVVGTPYAVPSGCVVEAIRVGSRNGVCADLPPYFALDGRDRPATPETPADEISLLPLSGLYRMASGEIAAVYGAVANPIN
ncbi:hypothetical protein V5E97_38020 [Singulisphaera sp. Ch08]|uniref:Uncharacterized protein n=1 Tax=Singulisphaera sp. Ch08 TaxID=3120278 RepID=A0AAU7CFN7_9BACT